MGRQIEQMASEPVNDFITTVTNFNSLNLVVEGITSKITLCQPVKAADGCPETPMVDLLFIVDSSSSVRRNNFNSIKRFLGDVVRSFTIGPEATQIGVIRYNRLIDERFTLNEYSTNEQVLRAIEAIPYSG